MEGLGKVRGGGYVGGVGVDADRGCCAGDEAAGSREAGFRAREERDLGEGSGCEEGGDMGSDHGAGADDEEGARGWGGHDGGLCLEGLRWKWVVGMEGRRMWFKVVGNDEDIL